MFLSLAHSSSRFPDITHGYLLLPLFHYEFAVHEVRIHVALEIIGAGCTRRREGVGCSARTGDGIPPEDNIQRIRTAVDRKIVRDTAIPVLKVDDHFRTCRNCDGISIKSLVERYQA